MNPSDQVRHDTESLIATALCKARQTRLFELRRGVRYQVAAAIQKLFGHRATLVVADTNTFEAAGRDVWNGLRRAGQETLEPFVFAQAELSGRYDYVESLREHLAGQGDEVVPVAVGSGTINDLTKLAAHELGRPYVAVATAASMDGYAAYGASIKKDGFKMTRSCAAPVAVLADLEVLQTAPPQLNASGYADLLAKVVAGADWLIADAVGAEPIDATAWQMVQQPLRHWVADPAGVRAGQLAAVQDLMLGLTMSGLAMQWAETSRPASGAEHQFSHLWDMRQPAGPGDLRSHGFQVGIGTLATAALYESLLAKGHEEFDPQAVLARWPALDRFEDEIRARLHDQRIVDAAIRETRDKYQTADAVARQLQHLQRQWHTLRVRLQSQLMPFAELRQKLEAAGCPSSPTELGIPYAQLRDDYRTAFFIRSRYTVLDLAMHTFWLEGSLQEIFAEAGPWPKNVF